MVDAHNTGRNLMNFPARGPASWMPIALAACMVGQVEPVAAQRFTIDTPGGPIELRVSHIAPLGGLSAPEAPQAQPFRPPSVFSAPLPSGSGARALGLGGAFTALADDATAASWNPAGLLQLERPEWSVVYRFSRDRAEHTSDDAGFSAGENETDSDNLNYFSLAYPFHIAPLQRNAVFSLNHQEAYDFTQRFTADLSQRQTSRARDSRTERFSGEQRDVISDSVFDVTVVSKLTTSVMSSFDQLLASDLLSELDFRQRGVLSALTPALGLELTPKLWVGAALNFYSTDPVEGGSIQSITRARYEGRSTGNASIFSTRTTRGTYEYEGVVHLPPGGSIPVPIDVPIEGDGVIAPFSDSSSSRRNDAVYAKGLYEEINTFEDLEGINGTFGVIYTVNRFLSLGATVDLPWTAEGDQEKIVRNTVTTTDARGRVLDELHEEDITSKAVEFRFPTYLALGAVVRWNPSLYSTLDVSQTRWSEFYFQAEGEPRINPLDGSRHDANPLDDCWGVRMGTEYLLVLKRTEIPLRAGVGWEERPALARPDDYFSVSLGSGLSIGRAPARLFLDMAYVYTWSDDVRGIVPEQAGLRSDIEDHQIYLSLIQHF